MKAKSGGLGRGLDALFGDDENSYTAKNVENTGVSAVSNESALEAVENNASRKVVAIENLYPCPTQPRQYFDEDALAVLATSIVEHGLLQPIVVRPDAARPGMFEIIAGERRWRASQKAQLHEVPVVVRELDDESMFQIALVENLQRQDLSAIEEARGYSRLNEDYGHSHAEIGKVLGRSRSHVANMIRLLDLPESVQAMVDVGDISMGHARTLIGHDQAFDLALKIIEGNLSVRATEKMVAANKGRAIQSRDGAAGKQGQKGFAQKDADTLALEKQISDQLGLGVTIDMKDGQKGKMTINFSTLDQLDNVLARLSTLPRM